MPRKLKLSYYAKNTFEVFSYRCFIVGNPAEIIMKLNIGVNNK